MLSTTEPCRAVSCIITRWGLENLKSASGISRQHHLACRDAERRTL
jgi:hypothetical protein